MSKTAALARLLHVSGLGTILRAARSWRGVLVLTYHRIGDPASGDGDPALFSATAEEFEAQAAFLARSFDVVGPEELAAGDRPARGRRVLITFDDGYRDNHDVAFPILRDHGVTATFFLPTGFIDRPRVGWWDEIAWMVSSSEREALPAGEWLERPLALGERSLAIDALTSTYKRLPAERTGAFLDFLAAETASGRRDPAVAERLWMTWEMAREMVAAGMTIGGHTVSHQVLSRLSPELQGEEISVCGRRIEEELGSPMRFFSYPVGLRDSFDEHTRRHLRERGVELAFSDYGGYWSGGRWDPYDVPRTNVAVGTEQERFRAKLTLPRLFARW